MEKLIGLVGAHRVGKSTLCAWLKDELHIQEIPVSIATWQAEENYDSSKMDYDWRDRKNIQGALLSKFEYTLRRHKRVLRGQGANMISERSPLDLVGYAVACAPSEPSAEEVAWLKDYTAACIQLTNTYYDKVFLVQPGIPFVETDKSPDEELVNQLNSVYLSLMVNPQLTVDRHILDEGMTDLSDRVIFIRDIYNDVS